MIVHMHNEHVYRSLGPPFFVFFCDKHVYRSPYEYNIKDLVGGGGAKVRQGHSIEFTSGKN